MSELRTNRIVPRDGLYLDHFGGGIIQVQKAVQIKTTFSGIYYDFALQPLN